MKSMIATTSLLLACAGTARAEWGALTQDPGPQGCFSSGGIGSCGAGTALAGPTTMTMSKDGKHVYVASQFGAAVAVLVRDAKKGTLSQLPGPAGCISQGGSGGQCASGTALDYSLSMALSPNGKQVYVASYYSSSVAVLTRDRKTGALTQLPGPAGCISEGGSGGQCANGRALSKPRSVAVSPNGKQVYVTSGDGSAVAVLQRNSATGGLTQLPGPEGCISAGGFGGCTTGRALDFPWSVAVSKDAKHVYVASQYSNAVAVLQRDPITGALTQRPGPEGCIGTGSQCASGRALFEPRSVTISPDGKHVYVASGNNDTIAVLQRDPITGALTQRSGQEGCISADGMGPCTRVRALDFPSSVAVSKDGKNVYVGSYYRDAVSVLQRDPTSGGLTQRDELDGCIGEAFIEECPDGEECPPTVQQCTLGRALRQVVSVAVSKDGKQVYAVSAGTSAVAVLERTK
ncbi:MAG TPA: beta-propeller fold lactonase family protein [Candidatus Binatia bacterium]|nr:beta-propeller fold lactonase family protein [Candidatus Binatia bacterium]